MSEVANSRVFEYEGGFYARPAYRGITMDRDEGDRDLDDVVYDMLREACGRDSGVSGVIRIRLEIVEIDKGAWVPRA